MKQDKKSKKEATKPPGLDFSGPTLEFLILADDTETPPSPALAGVSDKQLLLRAMEALVELCKRARLGGCDATSAVFQLGTFNAKLLQDLAKNPSEALLHLTRSNPIWPYFHSPKANLLAEHAARLGGLEIGTQCQLNVDSKSKWSWEGPARKWATTIKVAVQNFKTEIEARKAAGQEWELTPLQNEIVKLPPLTKATAKLWMEKVGRQLVMEWTNNAPEDDPELRPLGIHREGHGLNKNFEPYPAASRTAKSNIRDGIFKAIGRALHNMAGSA